MVLRLIPCSPRRRIRLVTVIRGLRLCLRPVGPTSLREFNTSNGCQNHTASPSAKAPIVSHAANHSRGSSRPAIAIACLTLSRPPHPIPTFVTMANAPPRRRDGGSSRNDLPDGESGIFFQEGLDTSIAERRT